MAYPSLRARGQCPCGEDPEMEPVKREQEPEHKGLEFLGKETGLDSAITREPWKVFSKEGYYCCFASWAGHPSS